MSATVGINDVSLAYGNKFEGEEILPLDRLQNIIRRHVYANRIRLSEFFKDYDRLSTGYVSPAQFKRALKLIMDRVWHVSEADFEILIRAYDLKNNGRVHYKSFNDNINEGMESIKRLSLETCTNAFA